VTLLFKLLVAALITSARVGVDASNLFWFSDPINQTKTHSHTKSHEQNTNP